MISYCSDFLYIISNYIISNITLVVAINIFVFIAFQGKKKKIKMTKTLNKQKNLCSNHCWDLIFYNAISHQKFENILCIKNILKSGRSFVLVENSSLFG